MVSRERRLSCVVSREDDGSSRDASTLTLPAGPRRTGSGRQLPGGPGLYFEDAPAADTPLIAHAPSTAYSWRVPKGSHVNQTGSQERLS